MGGSAARHGNVTACAEANIWNDPHAADRVFAADWNVTMVGLDVTERTQCTPEDFAAIAAARASAAITVSRKRRRTACESTLVAIATSRRP